MKLRIPIGALLVTALLSACAENAEPTDPPEPEAPQPADTVLTEKTDLERQLDVLTANYGVWMLQEEYDAWAYAVTDLDQNDRLELISTEMHGTGHYTATTIWEVDPTLTGLILCGRDSSCDLDILDRLAAEGGPQPCGPITIN